MNKSDINYTLYLVTSRDSLGNKDLFKSIEEAIFGGVTLVQLREKNISTFEFYNIAKRVKEITDKHNVPLIINDRLDITLAVDAGGLHIGQNDMPVNVTRKILGPNKILGVSASNIREALAAQKEGADYLGVGAIFPTNTKKDAEDVSLHELKIIKSSVNIPVVAIGGIDENNAPKVMETMIDGIAVVSAILGKDNILEASKNLYSIVSR